MAAVIEEVYKVVDPVKRAAQILHLMPKLHPMENGNGKAGSAMGGY